MNDITFVILIGIIFFGAMYLFLIQVARIRSNCNGKNTIRITDNPKVSEERMIAMPVS